MYFTRPCVLRVPFSALSLFIWLTLFLASYSLNSYPKGSFHINDHSSLFGSTPLAEQIFFVSSLSQSLSTFRLLNIICAGRKMLDLSISFWLFTNDALKSAEALQFL